MAAHYLAESDPRHSLAAPIDADLHGLPPLLIIVGKDEVLYSDAVALATAADVQGVNVTLEIYRDMIHVFPMFNLQTGDLAIERAADFARKS